MIPHRPVLAVVILLLFCPLVPGQDSAPPDATTLHRFLLKKCGEHFDARRKEVAALKTPEQVRLRQERLRRHFLEALGDLPPKTPLNARVVGRKQCDGYMLERVLYESRPDHHVTANLYLPDGKGPFPGVLMPCGHSANGKAAEAYQRACILMAKNGLAVLCYDPIGQGERVQLLDRLGKPAVKGSTTEHTLAGIGALLVGRETATYRIWDGIRSLDYLASRPEVDAKRLGCTGNSGGGTMTAYLMALDDRILAAAPSCYITSLERLFATIGPQDAEQNITGQVAFGMEHADYVTMRAPRPTLICTGTQDYFDIQGAWTSFREAKLLYGLLGHGERVDLFEYNDKHGFSKPRREAALRWMRRWLLEKDDAPTEAEFAIHKDAELQCTRTGQVLEDFKGVSVFDLNARRERELAKARKPLEHEAMLKEVQRLLALPPAVPKARPTARKLVLETEPGLEVYFASRAEAKKAGLSTAVRLTAGEDEYLLQLRGLGTEASRAVLSGDKESFLSLHLARPLLGQRVLDLLGTVEYLGKDVHLAASGPAGVAALHAAALDPRIKSVSIEGSLVSWSSVVQTPISKGQLPNAVPGVLAWYDLPELAALVAPRPLTIRKPVDAAGNPVAQAELERVYAVCRQAYAAGKNEKNLSLDAGPAH
jgi:cephalosporin-C deacetylase-like acetyl esterase